MRCRGDKAVLFFSPSCLPPFHTHARPLSSSQALILLASPRARRGVRVGSICLCDGHWCQAPRGLEGEERRLVLSGRVTDVSELSSGTPNGVDAEAEAGAGGAGKWDRDKGVRGAEDGEEERLGAKDSAEISLLLSV